jgi:hypothetical protein
VSGANSVVPFKGLDIKAGLPGLDREGDDFTLLILALPCALTRLTSSDNHSIHFRSGDKLSEAMSVMPWGRPVTSDGGVDGDEAVVRSMLLSRSE